MNKHALPYVALGVSFGVFLKSHPLAAQTLDDDILQSLKPIVVIALDTSSSMQYRNALARNADAGSCALLPGEKSRYITALEVLAGSMTGYQLRFCDGTVVSSSNYLTHAQRNVDDPNYTTECQAGCYVPDASAIGSGLIDNYSDSVKFVLATFDNVPDGGNNPTSGYSYSSGDSFLWYSGADKSGNVGFAQAQACSVESDCGAECAGACCISGANYCADRRGRMIPPGDAGANVANINAAIEMAMPLIQPTGGTPLAPMIEDLRYWFANDPQVKTGGVDPNAQCRRKYVVLITDGLPNMNCGATANTQGNAGRCQDYTPQLCPAAPSRCTTDAGFEEIKCEVDLIADCVASSSCHHCYAGFTCDKKSGQCKDANNDMYTPSSWLGVSSWLKPTSPNSYRDPGKIPVFVVGYNLDDTTQSCSVDSDCNSGKRPGQGCNTTTGKCRAATLVNDLAVALNTDCQTDAGGVTACVATDSDIQSQLTTILNSISAGRTARTKAVSTTRTAIPQFNGNDACPDPAKILFKFFTSFQVPETAIFWKGFLERIAVSYDTADTLHTPRVTSTVCPSTCSNTPGQTNFHDLLNHDPNPQYVSSAGVLTDYARRVYSVDSSGNVEPFDEHKFVNVSDLDAVNAQERNKILSCVWGKAFGTGGNLGECRDRMPNYGGFRMAGIWHSSPAVVGAPSLNLVSAGYETFKNATGVKDRPTMLYVGSMAGTLHAFNVHTGKEEWAFVPRSLQKKLKNQLTTAWAGMDGTVTCRDVQLSKKANDDQSCPADLTTTAELFGYAANMNLCRWRTVCVACFRKGFEGVSTTSPNAGHGCFALDVTKPTSTTWATGGAPFSFLWEINDKTPADTNLHDRFGFTLAEPLIGSVFIDTGSSTSDAPLDGTSKQYTSSPSGNQREVAVAVIPGGQQDPASTGGGANNGRDYWVVELMKRGSNTEVRPTIVKRIELRRDGGADYDYRASGGCLGMFDQPGTRLSSAYCGTSTGHIAMLDFGSSNPKATDMDAGWTVRPNWFYAFADGGLTPQPIQDAPAGAIDSSGNLFLVFGTGDTNNLEDTAQQRLLIVKQSKTTGSVTAIRELNLGTNEKVIGTATIYNDVAYLTTFTATTTTSCVFGQASVYGFQYNEVNICNELKPRLEDALSTACTSNTDCNADGGFTCDYTGGTCGLPLTITGSCRRLKKPLGEGSYAFGVDMQPVPATCTATVDPATQQLTGVSQYVPATMKIVVQTGSVPSSYYTAPPAGQGGPTANVTEFTPGAASQIMQSRIASWGTVNR